MNVLADYLYKERIYFGKIAAAILRDHPAGEDIVSAVFETFLEMTDAQVEVITAQYQVPRYVARAVKNRSIDDYRKRHRRSEADPALIEDSVHADNTPPDHNSEKFSKYPSMVQECLSQLEQTHPKQGQAVGSFLNLLIELDRKPSLDEQADRLGVDRDKLKCNLCLGLKAMRECIIKKGGSDPFKK